MIIRNDTSILPRALESIETELAWWASNRKFFFISFFYFLNAKRVDVSGTITVTSPSGNSHQISVYNSTNSAPRPEGYSEDYITVHGPLGSPDLNLSNVTMNSLYSQLASGAESGKFLLLSFLDVTSIDVEIGEDYTGARWTKEPLLNASDNAPVLR